MRGILYLTLAYFTLPWHTTQFQEVGRKESPVAREEGICNGYRVRADQEVGDDSLARPASFAVAGSGIPLGARSASETQSMY